MHLSFTVSQRERAPVEGGDVPVAIGRHSITGRTEARSVLLMIDLSNPKKFRSQKSWGRERKLDSLDYCPRTTNSPGRGPSP